MPVYQEPGAVIKEILLSDFYSCFLLTRLSSDFVIQESYKRCPYPSLLVIQRKSPWLHTRGSLFIENCITILAPYFLLLASLDFPAPVICLFGSRI